MKIAILGIDGYIGWPLALHLISKDHEVIGLDNMSRRKRVKGVSSNSLTSIDLQERNRFLIDLDLASISSVNIIDYYNLSRFLEYYKPDVIVHLAEQPSAPWSMRGQPYSFITQSENVIGTLNLLWAMKEFCPDTHLVKLGTMGEYGNPDCDIPEGEIPRDCLDPINHFIGNDCPMQGLQFPRSPNSFYHLSKVHDTNNIIFACKTWGLTSTDIMQGIVFGLMDTDEELITRFDYDEYFGTVINRFCVQALIGHPLTIYGKGNQTRGFLPLKDSIQCLTIAIENPPQKGEYRTLNQFESIYTINELARIVIRAAYREQIIVETNHIENPRTENEDHYYNPAHQKLFDLGYEPTTDIEGEVENLIKAIRPYKDRVIKEVIMPKTKWK